MTMAPQAAGYWPYTIYSPPKLSNHSLLRRKVDKILSTHNTCIPGDSSHLDDCQNPNSCRLELQYYTKEVARQEAASDSYVNHMIDDGGHFPRSSHLHGFPRFPKHKRHRPASRTIRLPPVCPANLALSVHQGPHFCPGFIHGSVLGRTIIRFAARVTSANLHLPGLSYMSGFVTD